METRSLNVPISKNLTDEQFYQLCVANKQQQLELTADGQLIIMPLKGNTTSINSELMSELANWNHYKKAGYVFCSPTEFHLPNGAYRSPDISWIVLERWEGLSHVERRLFPPLCPDFVMEVCSECDTLEELRGKMSEYRDNGTRLGWLVDLQRSVVEIYRSDHVETINFSHANPPRLTGEDVMPGFKLDLSLILNI
jgi:Uma2 family endonuclease